MDGFVKASSVVERILKKYGITQKEEEVYLFWEKVLGEELSKKISLVGIRGNKLLVEVSSPAHHHQLKMCKREWLKSLNGLLGEERFKDVKVVR